MLADDPCHIILIFKNVFIFHFHVPWNLVANGANDYFYARAWVKCRGPWEPVALRCCIGERPSSTRYWDQAFALTSASAAAAWANPEDIRQGGWREVFTQDTARTPPQTQKTEETQHKRLRAYRVGQATQRPLRRSVISTRSPSAGRKGECSQTSVLGRGSPWLQPQYALFCAAHCSHSAHLSAGRRLLTQERGEKLLER